MQYLICSALDAMPAAKGRLLQGLVVDAGIGHMLDRRERLPRRLLILVASGSDLPVPVRQHAGGVGAGGSGLDEQGPRGGKGEGGKGEGDIEGGLSDSEIRVLGATSSHLSVLGHFHSEGQLRRSTAALGGIVQRQSRGAHTSSV